MFDKPSLQPLRKDLLEAAIRYYESLLTPHDNDPPLLADLALARLRITSVYAGADREDDCIDILADALSDVERLRREFPESNELHVRLAGFWRPLRGTGKTRRPRDADKTDRTLKKLVELWEILGREHPAEVGFQSDLAERP